MPALNPTGGLMFPGSGGPLKRYDTKAEQITALTGWVYTANGAIADPCAAVELKLFRKKKDGTKVEVAFGDPAMEIMDLLNSPNALHTGEQLRQLHFTYMNIVGESYVYMRGLDGNPFIPSKGKLPAALDIFPAHMTAFRLGSNYSDSTVHLGEHAYPIQSIIRDLNPDPSNPWLGQSIVAAAAQTVNLEEQMKTVNEMLMKNGARPSVVFQTNEQLDDSVYERWKKQFFDDYTGVMNSGKPLLIEAGSVVQNMLSPRDLDYLASRRFSRDEILAMFRLSPGMIGLVENVNRANLEAGFYVNAVVNIVPRVRQFVRQVNASLVGIYDPSLELDFVNPVPEDADAKRAYVEGATDKFITKDEARAMYGLKPLPDGLGEHIIVTGNAVMSLEDVLAEKPPVAPMAESEDEPPEDKPGKKPPRDELPEDEDDPDDDDEPAKAIVAKPPGPSWAELRKSLKLDETKAKVEEHVRELRDVRGNTKAKAYTERASVYEEHLMRATREQFDAQKRELLTRLDQLQRPTKGYTRKDWLNDLVDWGGFDGKMATAIEPILRLVLNDTGRSATGELGRDPSQFNPYADAIQQYVKSRSVKIAKDVDDETEKQLRAALSQGMQAGATSSEVSASIENIMGNASTVRADRIARTETARAQSYADEQAWAQSEVVEGKEWFTAEDHVCAFCEEMDGKIVDLHQNFFDKGDVQTVDTVGKDGEPKVAKLDLSYDDIIGPSLHPNCRCTLLPVLQSN
ncbi:phage portal protein [Williamsia sterculiae]|uniref:phage portal protein n=1 Tax=Williamsia sterculiae TaxID=1344003 RepID=UPI0013563765|nr:phage portal protein [Williamsia sterculiae]